MPKPQQTDIVSEARELLNSHAYILIQPRTRQLLGQLCDEVERLREQWNTRFNTLCGLCGKRYLGPRDQHLHGYGRCDKKVSNGN